MVIVNAGLTVRFNCLVTVFEPLSVTRKVTLEAPTAVGVPLIVPLLDRLRPKGRAPLEMLQENPLPVPPLAARVVE